MKGYGIKHRHIFGIFAVAIAIAGWASIPFFNTGVKAGDVPILVRTANLVSPTGSVNPHGAAEFQVYANGQRELEVEIEDVSLPGGTTLTAVIDNATVGQVILAADGRGRLKLRTENGQAVPQVNDGSTVRVTNGSTVLVAGVFGGGGPNPTPTATPTGTPTGTPTPGPTASPSPTGTPNGSDLFAALSGPVFNGILPTGFAEFEIHSSRTELEIRVNRVGLPAGTPLSVVMDGNGVGNLIMESGGEGRLRLRSDDGQNVPAVTVGSTIRLSAGSTTLLSGTFVGFATPTPGGTPGPTPSPSPIQGRSFEANLIGLGTPANGEFKVTLSADETQAVIFGEFHNLSSAQTGARIETTTGTPVIVHSFGVVGGLNGNFAPVTLPVSAALVQQLRTGLWSAVITSVNNPNGEIRGTFRQRSNEGDFDGDGTNDIAVFRPTTGEWFTLNGNGFTSQSLGRLDDVVVSADYDGDGRTDAAIYRPFADGSLWEIKRSSDGLTTQRRFGITGDMPVRGDFDGDGVTDFAVFRPSEGMWYFQGSGGTGFRAVHFGVNGDRPVPGDMDGDGKDDIVVFRPSNGHWYWLGSRNTYNERHFGEAGDIPLSGDFDGDGNNDLAVYRPSNGTWYLQGSTGFRIFVWGEERDIPAVGDYDRDGKSDVAVWRRSTGMWYIIRSSDGGIMTTTFGQLGDVPTVAK